MCSSLLSAAVNQPCARRISISVGTSSRMGSKPTAPLRCGTRPVIRAARDGWQRGAVTWAFRKRWLSAASASSVGVRIAVPPIQPGESPFRSSAVTSSTFAGRGDAAATA